MALAESRAPRRKPDWLMVLWVQSLRVLCRQRKKRRGGWEEGLAGIWVFLGMFTPSRWLQASASRSFLILFYFYVSDWVLVDSRSCDLALQAIRLPVRVGFGM